MILQSDTTKLHDIPSNRKQYFSLISYKTEIENVGIENFEIENKGPKNPKNFWSIRFPSKLDENFFGFFGPLFFGPRVFPISV